MIHNNSLGQFLNEIGHVNDIRHETLEFELRWKSSQYSLSQMRTDLVIYSRIKFSTSIVSDSNKRATISN